MLRFLAALLVVVSASYFATFGPSEQPEIQRRRRLDRRAHRRLEMLQDERDRLRYRRARRRPTLSG